MLRHLLTLVCLGVMTGRTCGLEPIPDKLVVLTFDDASKSHFTVARPLLKKYGFGATFFITEGFDFRTNKRDYLTWEEIAQLHRDGFEVGNHTLDHKAVTADTLHELAEQVRALNVRCQEHQIPVPVSFGYPGNGIHPKALPLLRDLGVKFARRGGAPEYPYKEGRGCAYEPGLDHPLLIPSAGDARPAWTLQDFQRAVQQAKHGRIAVLQFHGVPDTAHNWVTTSQAQFESYLRYLAEHGYQVIALRDLAKYVDPDLVPENAWGVIEDRQRLLAAGKTGDNFRRPRDEDDLRYWLENMAVFHEFTPSEAGAALGLSAEEVVTALRRLQIARVRRPAREAQQPLLVLPYPGGRHPRSGFLDGALRPQRETKISVFVPWNDGGYVVVDVPEAIWCQESGQRELVYLAHTHVPTLWDKQGMALEPLEWKRQTGGVLEVERRLPNRVTFGTKVVPERQGVRLQLWLTNGTNQKLTDLRVQMCVLLKAAKGFEQRSNGNKIFAKPFTACRETTGKRWVIAAWEPCVRVWANAACPCLHSDPQIPDCAPGETQRIRGWLSFYEGDDIPGELRRLQPMVFGSKKAE
jgi:peptidoglycan/xylan/chitin deacetylase (PgdA/CDA1 family)